MTYPLPPLNALRAFEAAARHLSFKKAAEELNVTPAAISQQIKALEDLTGTQLFVRLTRALRLTDAGREALPFLTDGFEKLAEGAACLLNSDKKSLLTLSVSPSFGAMWLVPRLEGFYRAHPEIELRIDGTDRRTDIERGEADIAIRYGPGGYASVNVDLLFHQRNTPVCSTTLRNGISPLRKPADLQHHTLLHVDWKDRDASWRMWLLAAGAENVDPNRGPRFSQETMAVDAALDGQGVALIGDRLVADHLAAGRLVSPFGQHLKTALKFSYFLLSSKDRRKEPQISAFRDWVLKEVAAMDRPEQGY